MPLVDAVAPSRPLRRGKRGQVCRLHDRALQESAGLQVRGQQALDLKLQGLVPGACLVQEGRALRGRGLFQGGEEERLRRGTPRS